MDVVNQISQEMSLWKPQRLAITKLHSTLQPLNLHDDKDTIKASIPGSLSFDTDFPSFTFDMATGTGKTKLMAASIYYLFKRGISRNFFILVPGDTIYSKTIDDFTYGHPRFVLNGVGELPDFELITGENYERYDPAQLKLNPKKFNIFIFNIQKIWKKDFKFHSFMETLGSSFAELIKASKDLVVLMDESHHYRGDASFKAINELNPLLGLEYTATPVYKKNIIYSYTLADAVKDGLIKHLQAIIRKNDRSYEEELEDLKLIDGLTIHQQKQARLEAYCKNHKRPIVKPIAFISTKTIDHGEVIQKKIEDSKFMKGAFKGKTLFIHSGSEDEQIQQLVELEKNQEHEVVIHVNKLKEGWDVRNIYTIIPLRASISEILVEQTLGRGVRLPFYDVSKEEIEEEPEAFTLDVITYKLKGDNYKEVINAANANNIITKDYDEDPDKGKTLVSYEVQPTNKKYALSVPMIKGKIEVKGKLEPFDIEPTHKDFKKISAEKEAIEITSPQKRASLGAATQTTIKNQVSFLISKLIEEMDELDFRDKKAVEKIVHVYLKKATKSEKPDACEELLKMHRSIIFDDIQVQIQGKINDLIKVKHEHEVKDFEFGTYHTSISKEDGVVSKDAIADEKIKSCVVTGYQKSLYGENRFDSIQEKWFADIADKDKEVKKWIKNPKNQIAIRYKFGNYYPDFIVETADETLIVEIKSSAEIADPAVKEKAKEAVNWCKLASKVTGINWGYKLIPHDKIVRQDSFKAVISTGVKVD